MENQTIDSNETNYQNPNTTQTTVEPINNPNLSPENFQNETPINSRKKTNSFSQVTTKVLNIIYAKSKEFFYQTKTEEKLIILASLLTIFFTFAPWTTIKNYNLAINGLTGFLSLFGYLLLASAIITLITVGLAVFNKELPNFLPKNSVLHIIFGIEIIQLGLLSFTILQSINVSIIDTELSAFNIVGIVFCGVIILGSGLFENNSENRRPSLILPQDHLMKTNEDDVKVEQLLHDQIIDSAYNTEKDERLN